MPIPVTVVDDSRISRRWLLNSLPSSWDIDVTQASNGKQALEACRQGKAKIMFLDLTMPVMNGFQVLEQMGELCKEITVFVVSADIQPKAQQRVLQLGAKAFIRKPINAETIAQALQEQGVI